MKTTSRWLNNRIIPIALLFVGGGLVALGIARGEVAVVLQKAVRICLECIGIG